MFKNTMFYDIIFIEFNINNIKIHDLTLLVEFVECRSTFIFCKYIKRHITFSNYIL